MPADILITGDLVLDHHLYEGTKPSPGAGRDTADGKYRPLQEVVEWGGADLLCCLLKEVENAEVEEAKRADAEKSKAQNTDAGKTNNAEAAAGKVPEAGKVAEVKSYSPQT